jgi:hypothetical protein
MTNSLSSVQTWSGQGDREHVIAASSGLTPTMIASAAGSSAESVVLQANKGYWRSCLRNCAVSDVVNA